MLSKKRLLKKRSGKLLPWGIGVLAVSLALVFFISRKGEHPLDVPPKEAQPETATPRAESKPVMLMPPHPVVMGGTVQPGSAFSVILEKWLSPGEIHALVQQSGEVFNLGRIRSGQPWQVVLMQDEFISFSYEIDDSGIFTATRVEDGFNVSIDPIPYTIKLDRVKSTIDSNLFSAVSNAGEGASLAYHLADIFMWEVDFFRDIRQGDSFTVVVEKRYREGNFTGYGKILAARFINQGIKYEGFLLRDDNKSEYFTEEGKSLRKAFLKAPLEFRRISSGYNKSRLHPILKTVRPHYGVDYAAPTGTPIKAIGNGTVIAISRSKSAGKYVKIRHMNGYESSYLHMSRYAKGIRTGKKVSQGQTIGYVGSTGYATGPHLDFRIKRHGKFMDPRKVTSPRSNPVSKERMDEFMDAVLAYKGYLDGTLALQEYSAEGNAPSI